MRTYLKYLSRNKLYTFVSVFGLAFSLMFVILLGFYVYGEKSVDSFHSKADCIYMLRSEHHASLPNPAPQYIQELIPEVENYCRVANFSHYIRTIHGEKIKLSLLLVDKSFFTMFDFKLKEGDARQVLSGHNSIVLTREAATKIWDNENPIGKTVFDDKLTVSGIMDVIPYYSQFPQVDGVVSYDFIEEVYGENILDKWGHYKFAAYFLMKPYTDISTKAKMLENLFTQKDSRMVLWSSGIAKEVHFVPFRACYYDPLVICQSFFIRKNNNTKVKILTGIVLLILIIAILNYINMTMAQAGFRGREAAIRRLLGSSRMGLIRKFLYESFLMTVISFTVGILLAFLVEASFNEILETKLDLVHRFTPEVIVVIAFFIIMLSIISGILPALVISRFKPVEVIKGTLRYRIKSTYSKFLIVFQYFVSVVLLICSFFILMQSYYLIHTDLGFRTRGIMLIYNNMDSIPQASLRQELQKIPGVDMVSYSCGNPIGSTNNVSFNIGDESYITWEMMVDSLFFDFFEIKYTPVIHETPDVLFNSDRFNQTHLMPAWISSSMVNVVKPDPNTGEFTRGTYAHSDGLTHLLAGILPELKYRPLNEGLLPLLIHPMKQGQYPWTTMVRIHEQADRKTVEKAVVTIYKRMGHVDEVDYRWAEDLIRERYRSQTHLSQLITAFTLLTLVIMTMGVFAMSLYMIKQKEKEIALRKVNGATETMILKMLNLQSMKWFAIALLIAIPVSYWVMNRWLQTFTYHISLSWWVFVAAAIIVMLLSLVSTSSQSWRASRVDPVKYLKNE
ncbi:ABC transporter permease [Porphyromonas macacae]|uniref:Macrolide export ATP-binding/permease protein MacB n=1 Tax=Porphyromonas macacae TaxID=28115 RepID=A0A379DJ97_9PORP|nr:ABC transporter permease [Porphyromonas macacae]SUB78093.1 Macrolide export ATP-binding/permease protein MacB [Porphyromonas macacae]